MDLRRVDRAERDAFYERYNQGGWLRGRRVAKRIKRKSHRRAARIMEQSAGKENA